MSTTLLRWFRRPLHNWESWIANDNDREESVPVGPLEVVQYIGALCCGGAERQLCNLSFGLQRRGHQVRVRTTYALDGDMAHYCGLLEEGGIAARPPRALRSRPWHRLNGRLLAAVPASIRDHVYQLASELTARPCQVLNCWMDLANVIGGLAGLLAGVPRIALGLRTSNPTHFPRFQHDFIEPGYRWLIRSRRIQLLANSQSAAASYSAWLGLPESQIVVVPNGLDTSRFPEVTSATCQAARQALNLLPEHRVIAGVFRLFEEKQPERFLQVVRQVAARIPKLRVLLAGAGPLESEVRQIIAAHDMQYVQLLGRSADVANVLLASDVALLTSLQDSSPNALMEAQYLGVPVVATNVGGIPDIVRDGATGLLADADDADRLAHHIVYLLGDDELRQRFSAAARIFARSAFNLDAMIDRTLRAYRTAASAAR